MSIIWRIPGPELLSLSGRTCDNEWAGTNDNVKIHLRNARNIQCETKWVTNSGWYWEKDERRTWANRAELGDVCPTLEAVGGLEFRLELNTQAHNYHIDGFHFCKMEVQYGRAGQKGSSSWKWEGNILIDGWRYTTKTVWYRLTKSKRDP